MLSTKNRHKYKDAYRLNGWRKTDHATTNQRNSEVSILILDSENFIVSKVIKDEKGII